ncbi:Dihydrofolate reductase [Triplophysa tibetana]|uniref:dihydrofolate reductase n=1 Tax=Triplophysa tibetana TaxID=1572043 RepID=A0A5A9P2Z9_9TELE|nr:Dihydrofolate reductase [Triplophysa tibetana]
MDNSDEKMRKPIRLIAAACRNMGIGKNGQLPWSLPKEFQFLLDTVTAVSIPDRKNLVIWGRGSWFSCPAGVLPFANCLNVVLSRTLSAVPTHAHYLCKDFGSVIRLVSEPPLCHIVETIWVLGGPAVYKESLEHPWCDLIYLTDIMADFECDVFFPKFDRNVFRKQKGFPGVPDEIHEEQGITFQFQVFKKEA